MALTMFFILYAYYLLKTAREVFIFSQGGAGSSSSGCGQAQL
jgi:ATP/ADP translocase